MWCGRAIGPHERLLDVRVVERLGRRDPRTVVVVVVVMVMMMVELVVVVVLIVVRRLVEVDVGVLAAVVVVAPDRRARDHDPGDEGRRDERREAQKPTHPAVVYGTTPRAGCVVTSAAARRT